MMLANAHAKALLMLLKQAPAIPSLPPKPEPKVLRGQTLSTDFPVVSIRTLTLSHITATFGGISSMISLLFRH